MALPGVEFAIAAHEQEVLAAFRQRVAAGEIVLRHSADTGFAPNYDERDPFGYVPFKPVIPAALESVSTSNPEPAQQNRVRGVAAFFMKHLM